MRSARSSMDRENVGRGVSAAILIDALGGAAARIAPDATAFPHRTARAIIQIYTGGLATNGGASIDWLRETFAKARPLIGPGAYVNYIDADLSDWERRTTARTFHGYAR